MDDVLQGTAQLLVSKHLLNQDIALKLQASAAKQGQRFIAHLASAGVLSAKTIAITLAEHFNLAYIDLNDPLAKRAFNPLTIPKSLHLSLLQSYHILPLGSHQEQLYVAMDDPGDHAARRDLQFHTGMQIIALVAETTLLTQHLHQYLNQCEQQQLSQYANDIGRPASPEPSPNLSHEDDAPVVRLVHRLLYQALEQKASDIHFEPYTDTYRIRFRQDGLLTDITTPHTLLASRIGARVKIMADMDVSERRLPQDGRFTYKHQSLSVDCRVSSCPTIHGEKLVIRLLQANRAQSLDLKKLALPERDKTCLLHALARPQGLILVTGPTGSGKSTTLYSALNHINTADKNILTAEDPVEITCHGISQVQVNPKIGLNFARILRAFLRQDPDVIMIGEIRDLETAEIAIKASQTGHLVLSTLHTNSAAETLTRLLHLGLPAFQLISSLHLIIAQRLIRKLCNHCKIRRDDYSSADLLALGYSQEIAKQGQFYKAQGCAACIHGYHTRLAIFEVMPMTPRLNHLMMQHPAINPKALTEQAQQEGMHTLYQAGLCQAAAGLTSFEEVCRVAL